jgi:hypothetical protein
VVCSGTPTASPSTFNANSFHCGAQGNQGATSLFICTTYIEVSAPTGDPIARWDTNSVQSGQITRDGYVESHRFQLTGTTSGTLTHQGPAAITDYSLTWPSAQGSHPLLENNGRRAAHGHHRPAPLTNALWMERTTPIRLLSSGVSWKFDCGGTQPLGMN